MSDLSLSRFYTKKQVDFSPMVLFLRGDKLSKKTRKRYLGFHQSTNKIPKLLSIVSIYEPFFTVFFSLHILIIHCRVVSTKIHPISKQHKEQNTSQSNQRISKPSCSQTESQFQAQKSHTSNPRSKNLEKAINNGLKSSSSFENTKKERQMHLEKNCSGVADNPHVVEESQSKSSPEIPNSLKNQQFPNSITSNETSLCLDSTICMTKSIVDKYLSLESNEITNNLGKDHHITESTSHSPLLTVSSPRKRAISSSSSSSIRNTFITSVTSNSSRSDKNSDFELDRECHADRTRPKRSGRRKRNSIDNKKSSRLAQKRTLKRAQQNRHSAMHLDVVETIKKLHVQNHLNTSNVTNDNIITQTSTDFEDDLSDDGIGKMNIFETHEVKRSPSILQDSFSYETIQGESSIFRHPKGDNANPLAKIHKLTPSYTGGNEHVTCRIWNNQVQSQVIKLTGFSNLTSAVQPPRCQKVDLTAFEIASKITHSVQEKCNSNKIVELWLFLILIYCCACSSLSVIFNTRYLHQSLQFPILFEDNQQMTIDFDEMFKILYVFNNFVLKFTITSTYAFMLCIALRAYNSRLMFSKYFSKITSARKAQRNNLPHFRLSKTKHIKIWLTLRSYLKKRGPQRSIDVIVSNCFMLTVSLLRVQSESGSFLRFLYVHSLAEKSTIGA